MKNERAGELFSIGEAAKKCNITRRTLRYYEKLSLIKPDFVDTNGYRYYSMDTILRITIIKYLKIMNFTLEDIKIHLKRSDYRNMINSFDNILSRCKRQLEDITCIEQIVKDRKLLIEEAHHATEMKLNDINIKFIKKMNLIKYSIEFNRDYKSAILDLEFSNFVENEENRVTGPAMLYFPNIEERLNLEDNDKFIEALYIQKTIKSLKKEYSFTLKEGMYVSKYHFGSHDNISRSYEEIIAWEKNSDYRFIGPSIERFVADYRSTYDEDKFVTEIIAPIVHKKT